MLGNLLSVLISDKPIDFFEAALMLGRNLDLFENLDMVFVRGILSVVESIKKKENTNMIRLQAESLIASPTFINSLGVLCL